MLGADTAAVFGDESVDYFTDGVPKTSQVVGRQTFWRQNIVVQIAITDMAENHGVNARYIAAQFLLRFDHKCLDAGDRHGNIMLDSCALLFFGLRN